LFLHHSRDTSAADWVTNGRLERVTIHKLLERDAAHRTAAAAARRRLSDSLGTVLADLARAKVSGDSLLADSQPRVAALVFAQATAVCMDALTLCRQRGDSLGRADSIHTDSLARGLRRADSTIAQGVQVVDCHWGPFHIFPCWKRETAFKVGVVGGVTLTEIIRKVLTGHF
jgi:hypothetical protein